MKDAPLDRPPSPWTTMAGIELAAGGTSVAPRLPLTPQP